MISIIPFILFAGVLGSDALGCFSSVDTSHSIGLQKWGSQSLCAESCGDYPYVAIRDGGYCFCLSLLPTLNQVSDSQCDVTCNGYGAVNCGGATTFSVFTGIGEADAVASSSAAVSSSEAASSTASKESSNASSLPETSSAATSLQEPSSTTEGPESSITSESSSKTSTSDSVQYKTVTQTSGLEPSSSSTSKPEKTEKKLSNVGPIVGGVVGGIAGALILGIAIFFFIRRRNDRDEDDEEDFYKKGTSGGTVKRGVSSKSQKFASVFDMPMANPFVHPSDDFAEKRASTSPNELSDPRLNPAMMGRRRLSEGSLADEADYSRKILGVANP